MRTVDANPEHPKEECGVFGVYAPGHEAARLTFFGLFDLQHRGQESAGISVSDGARVRMHKEMGLVTQVFNEEILKTLPGHLAIGHTRYSTTGSSVRRNAQPVSCTTMDGDIAVAHNGNLINAAEIRHELEDEGEVFDTTNDSEVIAKLLARETDKPMEDAVAAVMRRVKGAYSVAVLTPRQVVGFRDPYGVRPLVVGKFKGGYCISSETCAFNPVGARIVKELGPGEIAVLDENGVRFVQGVPKERPSMCMFEFIYFSRPDSEMYDTFLYAARHRMGEELAREQPAEADMVVPVPDTGFPAALGYSRVSGIPFGEGLIKSRYIHRTFIEPDQRMREMGVRMKLHALADRIVGKRLVIVDDSIVRATTTKQIVRLLFDTGAAEVHVRITAPPIRYPCFYGIDMARRGELAAAKWSVEDIREHIGASSLGYLSVDSVVKAVGQDKDRFCLACFNGEYPIDVPSDLRKDMFERPKVGAFATVRSGQGKFEFPEDEAGSRE
ncbi:MAG: amidophosphoribosyltransferase [Armatimonadetes bacterium]|nr:amidophosphoribosyltransferase [Armatimonadota bacterium]